MTGRTVDPPSSRDLTTISGVLSGKEGEGEGERGRSGEGEGRG